MWGHKSPGLQLIAALNPRKASKVVYGVHVNTWYLDVNMSRVATHSRGRDPPGLCRASEMAVLYVSTFTGHMIRTIFNNHINTAATVNLPPTGRLYCPSRSIPLVLTARSSATGVSSAGAPPFFLPPPPPPFLPLLFPPPPFFPWLFLPSTGAAAPASAAGVDADGGGTSLVVENNAPPRARARAPVSLPPLPLLDEGLVHREITAPLPRLLLLMLLPLPWLRVALQSSPAVVVVAAAAPAVAAGATPNADLRDRSKAARADRPPPPPLREDDVDSREEEQRARCAIAVRLAAAPAVTSPKAQEAGSEDTTIAAAPRRKMPPPPRPREVTAAAAARRHGTAAAVAAAQRAVSALCGCEAGVLLVRWHCVRKCISCTASRSRGGRGTTPKQQRSRESRVVRVG